MNVPRCVLTRLESPRKPLPKVIPLALGHTHSSELFGYKVDTIQITGDEGATPLAALPTMGRKFAILLCRDAASGWVEGLYRELKRQYKEL